MYIHIRLHKSAYIYTYRARKTGTHRQPYIPDRHTQTVACDLHIENKFYIDNREPDRHTQTDAHTHNTDRRTYQTF